MIRSIAQEAYRLAMRHFHSNLVGMSHIDDTVEAHRDPTARRTSAGWVTFDYDPFLPMEQTEDGPHPVMLTTWHLTVESIWGDRVVLTLDSIAGDDSVRGTAMIDFYLDDTMGWDLDHPSCRNLDRLLTGDFCKDHPGDWSLEYREPEPDFDYR